MRSDQDLRRQYGLAVRPAPPRTHALPAFVGRNRRLDIAARGGHPMQGLSDREVRLDRSAPQLLWEMFAQRLRCDPEFGGNVFLPPTRAGHDLDCASLFFSRCET